MFADWETTVRAIDPELTEQDFAALREDLDAWLQKVISRHGVEAALILYPENPRAHELYRSLEGLGLSFLRRDRSAAVGRIRERAIQLFVQQPTPEQRTYLSNLLNVSYFLTVLSLDPSASRLVQDRVQGHRIYLDTNVLYRALGLSKVREVLSARRLLELSKQLGFELAITPWTLTEMKESLRRAEQSVKNRALPPRELAHLMAEATSQEGFVTAYWRQYKDKGITPNDFFAFYSALETLLEQDGIALINEGVIAVDFNESAINEELPSSRAFYSAKGPSRSSDMTLNIACSLSACAATAISRLRTPDTGSSLRTARYRATPNCAMMTMRSGFRSALRRLLGRRPCAHWCRAPMTLIRRS